LYNGKLKLHTIDPDIPEQFTEISKVQWFTQEEALNIVRDTNTRKKDIIRKVFKMLESYNSDYILF
jgi:NADH pyrophosphatase NudC (nudix superfamily)